MTIGEKIYKLRTSTGLSQKEFAQLIDASQTAVNFWENGKRQPKLEQLQKISDHFNITLESLLNDKPDIITRNVFNTMFGDYYNPVDGVADIHFTTDDFTIDEIEKILEYSRFLKTQRKENIKSHSTFTAAHDKPKEQD